MPDDREARRERNAQFMIRFAQQQQEIQRLKTIVSAFEQAAADHLEPETDPCSGKWPCALALAIEPDESILRLQAAELRHFREAKERRR